MTTAQRTSVAVSALAVLVLALNLNGCGSIFESNQAACRRMFHGFSCGAPAADLPPGFDFLVSQICATVPETSECGDWSAFADCVTTFFCIELPTVDPLTFDPQVFMACEEIATRLEDNGCFPVGF